MNSHLAIVFTKMNVLNWKKRVYIESLIYEGDIKYVTTLFGKEYRLLKTSVIFPESCSLDIYVDGNFKYRFKNMKLLFNFLEKQKTTKLWIPKRIINDPQCWGHKDALKIVRKIKLEEIYENNRKS